MPGRQGLQPRQSQRQQIAALGIVQGMQFVQHHGAQILEHLGGAGMGQQQAQLFRRGQQDVGRAVTLALAPRGGGVAGAGLHRHRQVHLGDRRFEIARHVHRQRLERRDVERVQAALAGSFGPRPRSGQIGKAGQIDQAGQETGQGLAAAGGRHQQHAFTPGGMLHQRQLMGARAASRGPRTSRGIWGQHGEQSWDSLGGARALGGQM